MNAHAFEDRDPVPLHTFPAGLQLVSSPAILSQRFETLGIDAAAYDPVSMQYVFTPIPPADTFHLGEGLWLLLAQPTPVFGSLPPIAIVFDVPLRAGWNLIGDPYLRIVPLSGVSFVDAIGSVHPLGDAITDGSISTLYGYHTVHRVYTRIDSSGSIEPWTGYWIYSSAAGSLRVEPLRT